RRAQSWCPFPTMALLGTRTRGPLSRGSFGACSGSSTRRSTVRAPRRLVPRQPGRRSTTRQAPAPPPWVPRGTMGSGCGQHGAPRQVGACVDLVEQPVDGRVPRALVADQGGLGLPLGAAAGVLRGDRLGRGAGAEVLVDAAAVDAQGARVGGSALRAELP